MWPIRTANQTSQKCEGGQGPAGQLPYLQVDDGAKLAEVLVELADVVDHRRDLADQQPGVGGAERPPLVSLVVRLVVARPSAGTKRADERWFFE